MADLPMGYCLPTSHRDLEYYLLPLLSPLTLFLHSFLHSPSHSQKLYCYLLCSLFVFCLLHLTINSVRAGLSP